MSHLGLRNPRIVEPLGSLTPPYRDSQTCDYVGKTKIQLAKPHFKSRYHIKIV